VNYWLDEIYLHRENVSIPKVLVGNKKDLDKDTDKDTDKDKDKDEDEDKNKDKDANEDVNERKVTTEEGRCLALKNKMIFFETSAFTGENVNDVFHALAKRIFMQNVIVHVPQKNKNIAFSKNHPFLPKKSCCL
jgi:GTPase SAR1 family protein